MNNTFYYIKKTWVIQHTGWWYFTSMVDMIWNILSYYHNSVLFKCDHTEIVVSPLPLRVLYWWIKIKSHIYIGGGHISKCPDRYFYMITWWFMIYFEIARYIEILNISNNFDQSTLYTMPKSKWATVIIWWGNSYH